MDADRHCLDLHRAFRAFSPTDGLPGRGRERCDPFFDRVQRRRARLAGLTMTTVDGHLGGGRGTLIGQTTAKGATGLNLRCSMMWNKTIMTLLDT